MLPGFPQGYPGQGGALPPPDCFAFYLPFHYFYPDWWGIYILAEGLNWFKNLLLFNSGEELNQEEALYSARIFLYSHEFFHHVVESFATRLEISHRRPAYKEGFELFYRNTFGTDQCLEEALATAYAVQKVKKIFPKNDPKREVTLGILERYIKLTPPGYRAALKYLKYKDYKSARCELAESSHRESFPKIPGKSPDLWNNSPHSFDGFANVKSRVSYLIPEGSPLVDRMQFGKPLKYKELIRKLKAMGIIQVERDKKKRGGHQIWQRPDGKKFPIPCHPRDLGVGLVTKIIKQAGFEMSYSQFINAN